MSHEPRMVGSARIAGRLAESNNWGSWLMAAFGPTAVHPAFGERDLP